MAATTDPEVRAELKAKFIEYQQTHDRKLVR